MITSILTYELKVAVLLAAFYMCYRLLLSKETFHKVNRLILLFTAVASFILPFCVITYTRTEVAVQRAFSVEIGEGGLILGEVIEDETEWWQLSLLVAMVIGAVIVAFKTLRSIYLVRKIVREGEHRFLPDGTEIVVSDKAKGGPFSWMHYIVLSPEDMKEGCKSIICHEQGHIEYGHSLDIILVDLLTSVQWFNPSMWMLRADLRALHEFQADDYALRSGINAKEYQLLLIKKAISMSGYSVANGFNHSILKNRITMMLSKKSSVRGLMKALYLIPAVGISLTAFAETKTIYVAAEEDVTNPVTESEVTENLPIEQEGNAFSDNANGAAVEPDGDEDEAFVSVEEMPKFPGGDDGLRQFLKESVKYPEAAQNKGIQGRVFVQFIVDKEGNVKKVKVARSIDKDLDAEAVRVVSSMPKWTPGKQRGQCVNVSYTVPIAFVLTDNGKKEKTDAQSQKNTTLVECDTDETFVMVEEMPKFPGGDKALRQYLKESVHYPEAALKKGVQGLVFVSFVVDKEGTVTKVKVAKSVDKELDAEAMRVVSAMPKWTPGKQRGQIVNVSFTVPVNFVLGGNDDDSKGKAEPISDGSANGEIMPAEFPGGEDALNRYLAENLKYPQDARSRGVEGAYNVEYIIDLDGSVLGPRINGDNVDQVLKDELVRVVKSMPNWTPATKNGRNVRIVNRIKVQFLIEGSGTKALPDYTHVLGF